MFPRSVHFFSPFFRRILGGCIDLGAPFVAILLDDDLPRYQAKVNKSEMADFLTGPVIFPAKGKNKSNYNGLFVYYGILIQGLNADKKKP